MTSTTAPPADGDELLPYPEAAEYLGRAFDRRRVKHQVDAGRLTPTRIGGRVFIRRSELDRFIAAGDGAAPPPRRRRAAAGSRRRSRGDQQTAGLPIGESGSPEPEGRSGVPAGEQRGGQALRGRSPGPWHGRGAGGDSRRGPAAGPTAARSSTTRSLRSSRRGSCRIRQLDDWLAEHGLFGPGRGGKLRPAVEHRLRASGLLLKYSESLGMTPASRASSASIFSARSTWPTRWARPTR